MSKKPDYITLCSIAAQKAGTSYGKYMAMHGYHPPIQADVEDVEAPQGISKICPQCGKEFTQGKIAQKIYCSLECQKAHAQRAAQRRYRDRKAAADAGSGDGAVMWNTGTAGSTASGAGISSDTTKAAGAAITYSSMGKSGLARLGRIVP